MYIEVALLPSSTARPEELHARVVALTSAAATATALVEGQTLDFSADATLRAHVRHVRLFEVDIRDAAPAVHVRTRLPKDAQTAARVASSRLDFARRIAGAPAL